MPYSQWMCRFLSYSVLCRRIAGAAVVDTVKVRSRQLFFSKFCRFFCQFNENCDLDGIYKQFVAVILTLHRDAHPCGTRHAVVF